MSHITEMYNKRSFRLCLVFIIMLVGNSAQSADQSPSILAKIASGYELSVGVSGKALTFDVGYNLDYREQNPGLADEDLDTLTVGDYTDLFYSIHNPYHYFSGGRWGYYFEYGYSRFSMRLQEVIQGDDYLDVNYGTGVNGWYMYLTPVLFYSWKPQGWFGSGQGNGENDGLLFGIGVGPGYLDAKGSIRLTGISPAVTHDFDVSGYGLAVMIVVDRRVGNWRYRIRGGGPTLDNGVYEYSIFEFGLDVGYVFDFRLG